MSRHLPPTAPLPSPSRADWGAVAGAAVVLAVVIGQLVNGFSAFFAPLEAEFGWGRADVSMANTAGLLGLAAGGILMGRLADRIGTRPVVGVGLVVAGTGFAAASQIQSLMQLHAAFFVIGCFGGGAIFGPVMALIGRRFSVRAGLALGLVSAGQAIGQGAMPPINQILIEGLGWRGALMAYGLTVLALLPLSLLFTAPRRVEAGSSAVAGTPLLLRPGLAVAAMSAAVLGCCTLMAVPLVHLVPLMEACGIPSAQAGGVMLVMMTVAIGGRIAFGRIADRFGALQAWLLASGWQTCLVFGFVLMGSVWSYMSFAVLYAVGYAGVMTSVMASIRALTPVESRSTAMGCVTAFAWVGHGVGGYAAGWLYDLTLDYTLAFGLAAAAGVMNLAVLGWLLRASTPRDARFSAARAAVPA